MENKWNTHFWSTQPENYRNKRLLEKVVLFEWLERFKRFISFQLHFLWLARSRASHYHILKVDER